MEPNVNATSEDLSNKIDPATMGLIFESLACNTLSGKKGINATELACIKLLERCRYNLDEVRDKYIGPSKTYYRFFFNSTRKKMTTIIVKDSSLHRLYTKGAAERIVKCCKFYQSKDKQLEMTPDMRDQIMQTIDGYNKEALRTITVAYRDLRPDECGVKHDEADMDGGIKVEEERLTFICALGIRDTLRVGVKEAVDLCHSAGIHVKMVTGDNKTTAKTIAENCGILDNTNGYAVMEGDAFSDLLGGLLKYCNGCNKEIDEGDLQKYKEKKRAEEREKKAEEKKDEEEAAEEEGDGDDDDEEPEIEKQEQQDECPYCKEKKVIEKVRRLDKFKEISPYLCVIARSRPLDKLLLVTALKELYRYVITSLIGDTLWQ